MPNVSSPSLVEPLGALRLENGATLEVEAAYEVYGRLSPAGDNAILLCHALTGSAGAGGAGGWWEPLIGPGRAIDTGRYAVLCSNILGSCYGTTGPTSTNPATGEKYGAAFPEITVGDMVEAQVALTRELGIRRLVSVAGGSLGGLQVLEWAARYPTMARSIMPVATNLAHAAWTIAFNECARQAIRNDPGYLDGDYIHRGTTPHRGLALARMIAMISYRSAQSFGERFGRQVTPPGEEDSGRFEVESYLHYQGGKLVERFDANAYMRITEAMDAYDVGGARGGAQAALAPFRGPALVMGIDSDILYPVWQQQEIVEVLKANGNAVSYREIHSEHGHDAFLMEWAQLDRHIREFMAALPA